MNIEQDPFRRLPAVDAKIEYWKELLTRPRLQVPAPECLDLFAGMKKKSTATPKKIMLESRPADDGSFRDETLSTFITEIV